MTDGGTRAELEDGDVWKKVADMFIDGTLTFEVPDGELSSINPNDMSIVATDFEISGKVLKSKFGLIKSMLARPWHDWDKSGNGDTDTFFEFCQGNKLVIFCFDIIQGNPNLLAAARRGLVGGTEEGAGEASNTSGKNRVVAGKRKSGDAELAGAVVNLSQALTTDPALAVAETEKTKEETKKVKESRVLAFVAAKDAFDSPRKRRLDTILDSCLDSLESDFA